MGAHPHGAEKHLAAVLRILFHQLACLLEHRDLSHRSSISETLMFRFCASFCKSPRVPKRALMAGDHGTPPGQVHPFGLGLFQPLRYRLHACLELRDDEREGVVRGDALCREPLDHFIALRSARHLDHDIGRNRMQFNALAEHLVHVIAYPWVDLA